MSKPRCRSFKRSHDHQYCTISLWSSFFSPSRGNIWVNPNISY